MKKRAVYLSALYLSYEKDLFKQFDESDKMLY